MDNKGDLLEDLFFANMYRSQLFGYKCYQTSYWIQFSYYKLNMATTSSFN